MKQYIIQKYVLANSAVEALRKAKTTPVHEVYLHGGWFEKECNYNFFDKPPQPTGFRKKTSA